MARHDDYEEQFSELALLAYQVAYRLTGDRHASEDVAQETMARAYHRWPRVRGYSEAWVVRVATNQVIGNWLRKHRHDRLVEVPGRATDDAVATRPTRSIEPSNSEPSTKASPPAVLDGRTHSIGRTPDNRGTLRSRLTERPLASVLLPPTS